MARSIAKGPKPRAGHASIDKNAPKPFAPKPFKPRPGALASDVRGPRPSKASLAQAAQNATVPGNTVAVALLRAHKHGVAKVDARMLLLHTLGRATSDAAWLITHEDHALTVAQTDRFSDACTRRRAGVPGRAQGVLWPEFAGGRTRFRPTCRHRNAGGLGA
jgi:release factor glutamine methyltransferase